jgi:hypothetical protein
MKTTIAFGLILFLFFLLSPTLLQAQKIPVNFGKVNPEDFIVKSPLIDSNTNAVIIADLGDVSFEGNDHGWVSYVYKRNCRVLFLNTKAMDLATVKLYFHKDDEYKQKLDKLSAITYNLDGGNVVQTKLNTDDVFEEKIDKNRSLKKFTMPAVKAGSIIEYSYTIKSDYIYFLPEWQFQSVYGPTLWSELKLGIPGLLSYLSSSRGMRPYDIVQPGETYKDFSIRRKRDLHSLGMQSEESFIVSSPVVTQRWVKKNVPEFVNEKFISSPNNYIDKISFQLYETYDGESRQKVSDSWKTIAGQLLEREDFGAALSDNNFWLDNILKDITSPNDNLLAQAKKIYYYVQQNFTCTEPDNFFIKTGLKDVVRKKSGTVGDINMLLLAMLKRKGIIVYPILLSTTDYGKNSVNYPRLDQLNYVIGRAVIDYGNYLLDASVPYLPFGTLPAKCYNGSARQISSDTAQIILAADSIKESEHENVIIVNTEKGIEGTYTDNPGVYNSIEIKNRVAKTGLEAYKNEIKKSMPDGFRTSNIEIGSLSNIEDPISQQIDFDIPDAFKNNDIVYFNPVITTTVEKNPFTATHRNLNVEFPFPMNETYNFSMEIPKGYKVDELPKSVMVKLDGGEGFFEYAVSVDNNTINLYTKTVLYKTNFSSEDYENLRSLFAYKVKKEAEQIVFKKIK